MNAKQHIKSITIVVAVNVGHNFGLAFRQAGYLIHEIYSRTQNSALLLSQTLNCNFTTKLSHLSPKSDLFILAVNDDAIESVIDQIQIKNRPIIHTSGSTPINIFENKGFEKYGIFYPVQSFSKNETESLSPIPICVEGNNQKMEDLLISLASSVSNKVYSMDSEKRKALHVASVFANNFANQMFQIAYEILKEHHISFEIIRPLIAKTSSKIENELPFYTQTGPAIRKDKKLIESHLNYLEQTPEHREIYDLVTKAITKSHQTEN